MSRQRLQDALQAEGRNVLSCSVSLDVLSDPCTTECGHTFSADSLNGWFAANELHTCPFCTVILSDRESVPNHAVAAIVKLLNTGKADEDISQAIAVHVLCPADEVLLLDAVLLVCGHSVSASALAAHAQEAVIKCPCKDCSIETPFNLLIINFALRDIATALHSFFPDAVLPAKDASLISLIQDIRQDKITWQTFPTALVSYEAALRIAVSAAAWRVIGFILDEMGSTVLQLTETTLRAVFFAFFRSHSQGVANSLQWLNERFDGVERDAAHRRILAATYRDLIAANELEALYQIISYRDAVLNELIADRKTVLQLAFLALDDPNETLQTWRWCDVIRWLLVKPRLQATVVGTHNQQRITALTLCVQGDHKILLCPVLKNLAGQFDTVSAALQLCPTSNDMYQRLLCFLFVSDVMRGRFPECVITRNPPMSVTIHRMLEVLEEVLRNVFEMQHELQHYQLMLKLLRFTVLNIGFSAEGINVAVYLKAAAQLFGLLQGYPALARAFYLTRLQEAAFNRLNWVVASDSLLHNQKRELVEQYQDNPLFTWTAPQSWCAWLCCGGRRETVADQVAALAAGLQPHHETLV